MLAVSSYLTPTENGVSQFNQHKHFRSNTIFDYFCNNLVVQYFKLNTSLVGFENIYQFKFDKNKKATLISYVVLTHNK